jgi:arylsulfatase A-like enzyme
VSTRQIAIAGAVITLAAAGLLFTQLPSAPPATPTAPDEPAPPSTPAPAGAPNVLLIVWDTTRADRMSLYGAARQTTPRLDAWAKDAAVYERAISPEMWTPPSHSSMFTGFAPQHHGVKATYKWLDAHFTTLAEWLGQHGWDTYAWSANPYLSPDTNIMQGFGTVETTFSGKWKKRAKAATKAKLIPADKSTDISPGWDKAQKVIGDAAPFKDAAPLAHEALDQWIGQRQDPAKPWFAFVNMMEVHIPRVPSLASREALLDKETIERGYVTSASQIDLLAYTFGKKDYTADELAAMTGVYDAALRDMDAATFDMLDDLQRQGKLDNTIVILTADHGENLGDHHMFGHKFSLYDTLLHVPLVIWWPGHVTPARVETPVSALSLFATVLDATDLPTPDPKPDLGTSLLDAQRPSPLFSEFLEATPVSIKRVDEKDGIADKAYWLRTFKSVEEAGWKLITASDGSDELFHVTLDPDESDNLAADNPDRIEQLKQIRAAWDAATPDYDSSARSRRDKPADVDAATKEMLSTLGYADPDK